MNLLNEIRKILKAAKNCPHFNETDQVVTSNVTCETIHTVCEDCGTITNIRTDC